MDVTTYCYAEIMFFFDAEGQLTGYQLHSSPAIVKDYILEFPLSPPEKTIKSLVLRYIRVRIEYHKDNITDEKAKITFYEITEAPTSIYRQIEYKKDDMQPIVNDVACCGFAPTDSRYANTYDCDFCLNNCYCLPLGCG